MSSIKKRTTDIIIAFIILIIIFFFTYYIKNKYFKSETKTKIEYITREIYINERIKEYDELISNLQLKNDSLTSVILDRNNRIMDLKREKIKVINGVTKIPDIKTDEELKKVIMYLKNIK